MDFQPTGRPGETESGEQTIWSCSGEAQGKGEPGDEIGSRNEYSGDGTGGDITSNGLDTFTAVWLAQDSAISTSSRFSKLIFLPPGL